MIETDAVFTVIDQGVEIPWNLEPPSVAAARADVLRIDQDARDIAAQLETAVHDPYWQDLAPDDYHRWRKRAMWAKRSKERRLAFLKSWLREQHPEGTRPGQPPGQEAMLAVLTAAERCLDADTDEAWYELRDRVQAARAVG